MTQTLQTLVRDEWSDVPPARVPDPSMARLEPVKRLMLAVLGRAVNDFRAYAAVPTARGRRLFNEIDAWFRASTDGPFDFETICHATGLDPDFIRKRLRSSYGVHADASTRRMRGLRATSPGFVSRSALRGPGQRRIFIRAPDAATAIPRPAASTLRFSARATVV